MPMQSLRTKYLFAVLGTVVVVLSLTAWYAYRKAENTLTEMTFAYSRSVVGGVARELNLLLTLTQGQLNVFTTRGTVKAAIEASSEGTLTKEQVDELEQRLRTMVSNLLDMTSLLLINERGEVLASSDRTGYSVNRAGRPYFQKAMRGQFAVEGPLSGPAGRSVYAAAVPVLLKGEARGVLAAALDLDHLSRLLIDPVKQIPGASLFVMSQDGHVIMHSRRPIPHADWKDTPLFRELQKKVAGLFPYEEVDGTPMLATCAELPMGWRVIAAASREDVFRNAYELRDRGVLVTLVSIVLVGGLLLFLINNLCRDLLRGVRFAESVAAGNLDQKLVLKRRDELGMLATALTSMVETLRRAITISEKRACELEAITEGVAGGVAKIAVDEKVTVLWGNPAFYQLSGRTKEEYTRDLRKAAHNIIHPDDFKTLRASILKQAGKRETVTLTYRILKKDGSTGWNYMKARYIEESDMGPVFLGVFMDITPKVLAMQALEIEQQRYRALAKLSNDIIFEYEAASDTLSHLGSSENIFGSAAVIRGFMSSGVMGSVVHPEDAAAFSALCLTPTREIAHLEELRIKRKDEEYHWYRCSVMHIFDLDGKPVRCIVRLSDIDRHKLKEKELLWRTQFDGLTGCYNKITSEIAVQKTLAEAPDEVHVLYIIDVDDFKQANDKFGHAFGDSVLRAVAELLKATFRSTDLCGRVGGDEFIIFARQMRTKENAVARLENLYASLATLLVENNPEYRLSLSVGFCLYPAGGASYEELFKHADEALYNAKRGGKGRFALYGDTGAGEATEQRTS